MRRGRLILAGALSVVLGPASAQDSGLPRPVNREESQACEYAESHTPDSVRRLLSLYPRGGDELTFQVYSIVTESPRSAPSMVAIANLARPAQIAAIARGLLQALERLDTASPQCLRACPNQGDGNAGYTRSNAQAAPGENQRVDSFNNQDAALLGDECGIRVRAALLCASPAVDAVLAALAEQRFALADTSVGGHCNAPIYAGAHTFSGSNVTASPFVSRN